MNLDLRLEHLHLYLIVYFKYEMGNRIWKKKDYCGNGVIFYFVFVYTQFPIHLCIKLWNEDKYTILPYIVTNNSSNSSKFTNLSIQPPSHSIPRSSAISFPSSFTIAFDNQSISSPHQLFHTQYSVSVDISSKEYQLVLSLSTITAKTYLSL